MMLTMAPFYRWLTDSAQALSASARALSLFALLVSVGDVGLAQNQPSAAAHDQGRPADVAQWLARMQQASSRNQGYVGTFVVSSGNSMTSARIWHVCEGDQQVERIENLTGPPRSTFRHNSLVMSFWPESRTVRKDWRDSLAAFPALPNASSSTLAEFYAARVIGADRVAGFDADVLLLSPTDQLRYGYRVWSEKKSGLMIKLQTLDVDGKVLEQSAFSELQLNPSLRVDKLLQMMNNTSGYRVEKADTVKTTALAEGWILKSPVAGFQSLNCYRRSGGPKHDTPTVHWVFSDGLASVSLFIEPYDVQKHPQESIMAMGATQTLTRRINDWWLTAVGEVPPQTLKSFALNLERKK